MDKLQHLGASWSIVANSYRDHFVPRFKPWVLNAVDALLAQNPNPGLVFAPGCGTGDEIVYLAERLPNHSFFGLDLSEGMVDVAKEAVAAAGISDRVQLMAGDASTVPAGVPPLAAVFTCFALQQMPKPKDALAAWTAALAPGGVLVACFWPTMMEVEGPWRRLIDICPPPRRNVTWEEGLLEGAQSVGCTVILDELISHEMVWPSVADYWEVMTRGGPWYSRRLELGDEKMEETRQQFMTGPYADPNAPLKHSPNARLVVLRRNLMPSL